MQRYRLEVWNETGDTRLAIYRRLLDARQREILGGEETLTVRVDILDGANDHLTRGSVLRLQEVGTANATLWRFAGARKERGQDGSLAMEIEADALWMDFRHGMLRDAQTDGRTLTAFGLTITPTQWLTSYIVPAYDGTAIGFAVGTVEPTALVSLTFDQTSPLEALRILEEELQQAEVQFRLNGAGDTYLVDILTRVGQAAGGAELRYGKNVRGMVRETDETETLTRIYAKGSDGLNLGDAEWIATGASDQGGNVYRVTFGSGEDNPVHEDDALVGQYFYVPAKTGWAILDSDAAGAWIDVQTDGVTIPATDDVGRMATDAAGARLMFLESPSAVAALGVRVGSITTEIPHANNLLYPNGNLSTWTLSTEPDGWTVVGTPTTVEESTSQLYAKTGSSAARVVADAADEGLISDAVPIESTDPYPFHSILAGLTVASGRVRMELVHSNGKVYPIQEQAQAFTAGTYATLRSYPVHADPLPTGTAQLRIVSDGDAAEFYLDAAMVTPTIGATEPRYVDGQGGRALWREAAAELGLNSDSKLEYTVDVVDLYEVDPAAFAFDHLELGDDVKVRDPDIGTETLRIVEIGRDLLKPETTDVSIAADAWSRPNDPWRSGPSTPSAGPVGSGLGTRPLPAILEARDQVLSTGVTEITAVANAETATMELYVVLNPSTDNPTRPGTPHDTINDRQGTFGTIASVQEMHIWVVPLGGSGAEGTVLERRIYRPPPISVTDPTWHFYERLYTAYSIAPGGTGDTGPLPGATTLKTIGTMGSATNAVRVEITGGAISGTYTEDYQVTPGALWSREHRYSEVIGDALIVVEKPWPRDGTNYTVTLTPYSGWSGSAATGQAGDPVSFRVQAPGGLTEPYSDAHPASKYYVDDQVSTAFGGRSWTVLSISSGTVTPDWSSQALAVVTLTEDVTIALPSPTPDPGTYILLVRQDGLGPWAISSWNAGYTWPQGAADPSASGGDDIFTFVVGPSGGIFGVPASF